MNERIRELAEQARIQYEQGGAKIQEPGQYYHEDVVSKFAELIVKECMESLWTEECHTSDLAVEEYNRNCRKIKQHFGVEE